MKNITAFLFLYLFQIVLLDSSIGISNNSNKEISEIEYLYIPKKISLYTQSSMVKDRELKKLETQFSISTSKINESKNVIWYLLTAIYFGVGIFFALVVWLILVACGFLEIIRDFDDSNQIWIES